MEGFCCWRPRLHTHAGVEPKIPHKCTASQPSGQNQEPRHPPAAADSASMGAGPLAVGPLASAAAAAAGAGGVTVTGTSYSSSSCRMALSTAARPCRFMLMCSFTLRRSSVCSSSSTWRGTHRVRQHTVGSGTAGAAVYMVGCGTSKLELLPMLLALVFAHPKLSNQPLTENYQLSWAQHTSTGASIPLAAPLCMCPAAC